MHAGGCTPRTARAAAPLLLLALVLLAVAARRRLHAANEHRSDDALANVDAPPVGAEPRSRALADASRKARPSIIVKLAQYKAVALHEQAVRAVLPQNGLLECTGAEEPPSETSCHWSFKKRANRAVHEFPTDFLLLEVDKTCLDAITVALTQRSNGLGVDSIRHEQAMTRTLSSVPPPVIPVGEAARIASFDIRPPFEAKKAWDRGYYGQGVRVAVFDTGIQSNYSNFEEPIERTNWTDEKEQYDDNVGHGTFVASLIAGKNPACPGIAPKAQIVTFRVFTGTQISYTSWFLDAFNFALYSKIDILNLSIGGPDSSDEPFVEKINELTAAGIVVISAIGNDGPLYGTLNNPADMLDVIGVGGMDPDGQISSFSSRGMTLETNFNFESYGRVKPDLVAHGRSLAAQGLQHHGACARLSGTSVASPVVAATAALMISAINPARRKLVVNPASVKKALLDSCVKLPKAGMFEQGAGLLNIPAAVEAMRESERELERLQERNRILPKDKLAFGRQLALFPSHLDLSEAGCPYMWPLCSQPLYATALTTTINVTVLNPGGIKGQLIRTEWLAGTNGEALVVTVTPPARFWPWTAGFGVHLGVAGPVNKSTIAYGILRVTVQSELEGTESTAELPIRAEIVPTPAKEQRILFDYFHNVQYPPAYIPRDSLRDTKDMLDWLGDHPHTNFHEFYRALRRAGYFVEVWSQPLSCLGRAGLARYGFLFLVDTEEFFFEREVDLIEQSVLHDSLHVIVAAEWYNANVIESVGFMDDNTRSYWKAVIGGGNVPGLNHLLDRFGIQLSDSVVSGQIGIGGHRFSYESGSTIARAPAGSELLMGDSFRYHRGTRGKENHDASVVVLSRTTPTKTSGSLLVYGDSHCLDTISSSLSSDSRNGRCYGFFVEALLSLTTGSKLGGLTVTTPSAYSDGSEAPVRLGTNVMNLFEVHSRVVSGVDAEPVDPDTLCYATLAGSWKPTSKTELLPKFEDVTLHGSYVQSVETSYSFMSTTPSALRVGVLSMASLTLVFTATRIFGHKRRSSFFTRARTCE